MKGTLFSDEVNAVVQGLEDNFSPGTGEDLSQNIGILDTFSKFNKAEFEAYLSKAFLISLNDEEFELLKNKVKELKRKNALKALGNIEEIF